MIFGTDYYPEHWSEERWEKDAELMRKIGINTIRIGEFGWSVIERTEGKLDFSLYDKAIALFAKYGIKVIMGTPTAAPPAWLCQKYPDLYMRDRRGVARGFGSRRHYCYRHEGYHMETERIVTALAERYGKHPNVIAWQIDNELGCEDDVLCYCDTCREKFILWLKEKYGSLEALNEAWGAVFWSQTYTEWEQIILPKETVVDGYTGNGHNPGLMQDFKRFSSDSVYEYAKLQTKILRRKTRQILTHNMVSEQCDNYKLAKLFDVAGYDAYPVSEWDDNSPGRIGFHYDLSRGYAKKPLWILEQQSGPCGWNIVGKTPEDGQLRLWSIQAAARGIQALVYFRWRSCPFGTEQYWYGILDHDGVPRKRHQEIAEAIDTIRTDRKLFGLPEEKRTLLVYDYDNKFSHDTQPHTRGFCYKEEVIRYYEALRRLHVPVWVGSIAEELTEYKAVALPFFCMIGHEDARRLEAYVRGGGILILTPFSGQRLQNNQITTQTLPGEFRSLAGVTVAAFHAMGQESCELGASGTIRLWYEELELNGAVSFNEAWKTPKQTPLVSENTYGKGKVFYISCCMERYDELLQAILTRGRIFPSAAGIPSCVECIEKKNGKYLLLMNHSEETQEFLIEGYRDFKTGEDGIRIEAYGFSVALKKE
ncbi:MAG: beta-galactosidase [Lachnospiraceae bacterium]|nr:beta-galactosidase [Lachnospiraceae bacterium]